VKSFGKVTLLWGGGVKGEEETFGVSVSMFHDGKKVRFRGIVNFKRSSRFGKRMARVEIEANEPFS